MITIKLVAMLLLLFLLCIQHKFVSVSGKMRCHEREKEALLAFKRGLIDESGVLSTWGSENEKKECCSWYGVQCSNTTGYVESLQLHLDDSLPYGSLRGEISPSLLELHNLSYLELSRIKFGTRIPQFIGSMKMLQHLNLNSSDFHEVDPHLLGNLTGLRSLDLSWNSLTFENLNWLSHLSSLSHLYLNGNNIRDSNWPQHILMLHSLETLKLQRCQLSDGAFSKHLLVNSSATSHLAIIDLSINHLTISTLDWLFDIKSLVFLNASDNLFDGLIPESVKNSTVLEGLDLSKNKLKGGIPTYLGNLSRLLGLNLANNGIRKPLVELMGNLSCKALRYLSLGDNELSGSLPDFSSCITLRKLSLENNNLKGPLTGLAPLVELELLFLPNNSLEGPISLVNFTKLSVIDISFNAFSGPLPPFPTRIEVLKLSNNGFSRSLASICNKYNLRVLDVSYNRLAGELPSCWKIMNKIRVINLASNNFVGEIPHSLGYLQNLTILHLNNNSFTGALPSTLKNCRRLLLIDVGENNLTGGIRKWIGVNYRNLEYLILRHNRFHGKIPQEICNLSGIKVLDLSRNNLSGEVPRCLNNFTSLAQKSTSTERYISVQIPIGVTTVCVSVTLTFTYNELASALIQWKGKESEYEKTLGLLKLIDLSSNRLTGTIPRELFDLKGLVSLNLSRNHLAGKIPMDIGHMENLEALDLSRNHLSGAIPVTLAQLHYLQVLDLAYNNLSGEIPKGTQLQSFNESDYTGNSQLCGPPLPLCPKDVLVPPTTDLGGSDGNENGFMGLSVKQDLGLSIALGFIFGFWAIIGPLSLKTSWRNAYFSFLDGIGDRIYRKLKVKPFQAT